VYTSSLRMMPENFKCEESPRCRDLTRPPDPLPDQSYIPYLEFLLMASIDEWRQIVG